MAAAVSQNSRHGMLFFAPVCLYMQKHIISNKKMRSFCILKAVFSCYYGGVGIHDSRFIPQSPWIYHRKSHFSLGLRSMNYYIHTIINTCVEWLLASVLFYWVGVKNTKAPCYWWRLMIQWHNYSLFQTPLSHITGFNPSYALKYSILVKHTCMSITYTSKSIIFPCTHSHTDHVGHCLLLDNEKNMEAA